MGRFFSIKGRRTSRSDKPKAYYPEKSAAPDAVKPGSVPSVSVQLTPDVSASPPDSPQPCRYVITPKSLGKGAYGSVLVGERAGVDEEVAVKIIADGRMKPVALAKEVALLHRLSEADHPALPRFYAHVKPAEVRAGAVRSARNESELPLSQPLGESHCLAMQMARGGEVFEHVVACGGLDETESAPLAAQLCDAVRAAHALGIAHRDLKLENVLFVGRRGEADGSQIILIDWGLAHQHMIRDGEVVHEMLRSRCGSRSYMAPEVADRSPSRAGYNGFVSDVWSLGVCLFAMNLGFFPFEQADPQLDWRARRVLDAQRAGRSAMETILGFYPRRDLLVSPALKQLLDTMLVFDPANRASLAEVLGSAWLAPHVASPMEVELEVDVGVGLELSASCEPPARRHSSPAAVSTPASANATVAVSAVAPGSPAPAQLPSRQLSPLTRCRSWGNRGRPDGAGTHQPAAQPGVQPAAAEAPASAAEHAAAMIEAALEPGLDRRLLERQESGGTAVSSSSGGSSVVRSMARLQQLVERTQPPPPPPACFYAVAGSARSHRPAPPPPQQQQAAPQWPEPAARKKSAQLQPGADLGFAAGAAGGLLQAPHFVLVQPTQRAGAAHDPAGRKQSRSCPGWL